MTFTPHRRHILAVATIATAAAAAGLLASCAGLIGPRQFEVPLERLQKNLGQRFPVSHRVLGVFDVQLSNPQLSTVGQNDRVALSAELTVSPMLMRQSWRGSLALSGRLVVDNARSAVFLSDAQVDRFAIDGIAESQQRQIAGAANILADKLIRDVPLYSFKPEDLRYAGVQFVPTGIRTTSSALVIMLEPATQAGQTAQR
ncbi:hypothetical protein ASD15_05575 [Massilia sp. Root351]|jgi:hypothetical protein|uniref:DUF1439 domain-containing protein n=1 Tax=Massilia sp. Root351 TaxID=1736522 RepID=UPI0007091927|nr:DUF1439 domain-containing protein [Massilia sp. Root351]KQV84649.1 hypothetical protein ASD15_05575 [Massilia sp. Root351]